jgi:hypothetical protein
MCAAHIACMSLMNTRRVASASRRAGPAQFLARAAVKGYQLTLSPLIGSNCRHLPTCSQYADEAFASHSGPDFVPDAPPVGARWYLPWRYGWWRATNTVPPAG